jgi:heme A synthase
MQNASSLTEITAIVQDEEITEASPEELAPERRVTLMVNRITGLIGAVFLLLALLTWFARSGHYRLVLALLLVALFASILHSYTFEDGEV